MKSSGEWALAVGTYWRSKENKSARARIHGLNTEMVGYDLYVTIVGSHEVCLPNFLIDRDDFLKHFRPEVVSVDFKSQNTKGQA